MQNNMIQGMKITFISGREFTLSPLLEIIAIIFLLSLIVSLFILLIRNRIKNNAWNKALLEIKQLTKKYKELDNNYKEASVTHNQTRLKYEELMVNNDKLKKLAYLDNLTQLPNRLSLKELMDNVMLTLRNGETIALLNLNIDNFKQINDLLGYSYGDEILIDVTHRIKQVIDENDFLARLSGDEFAILTQNILDISEYEDKLRRILNVFSYPFVLSMQEKFVSVSMGITFAPKDGKTTLALLKNASVAMKVAKSSGKNTYVYFENFMNEEITKKIEFQSELRKAIENNEFHLHYQPIIDLKQERIVGYEALIRWEHPTKGILLPKDFISYAEESGLIAPIGIWSLKEACSQLKQWEDAGYPHITMAFNISMRQFKDPEFVSTIWDIVSKSGIKPNKLEIEITENTALDDIEYTIATMTQLKELGVSFNLDNFGTSYSSMRYLKKLPVKNIKIDKTFLDNVLDSIDDQNVVKIVISLLKTYRFNVVAEGIEFEEQDLFLKEIQCDMAQGFLYSKPLVAKDAFELLRSGHSRSKSEDI